MKAIGLGLNQGLELRPATLTKPALVLTRRFGFEGVRFVHTTDKWKNGPGSLFRRVQFSRPWVWTRYADGLSKRDIDHYIEQLGVRVGLSEGKAPRVISMSSWNGWGFDREF
jgi:hypothetical protein